MSWIHRFFIAATVVLIAASASAVPVSGVVRDSNGQPLPGVTVTGGATIVTTDEGGRFAVELESIPATLTLRLGGFRTESQQVVSAEPLAVTLRRSLEESIVVSGIRAADATPVTKTTLKREDIEREYHGQDIPLLLQSVPGVNAYTESGVGGSGYSYISLRGIGSTRINFTLDGVPLADSEDMATYFADFPDLARSLQSIQIQRGVGTSTVGAPSFGGSVNMESLDANGARSTSAEASAGSYGTRHASVAWQSGALPGGYAFYTRLSGTESDGFRRSSGVSQQNLFFSGVKQNDDSQLRLTGFTAHEKTQQSFLATDADTLKTDLRANDLSAPDRDSFGYDLAQLQYLRALSPTTSMTASVFYQRGYGWYRLLDDEATQSGLRQYGLDGMLMGTMLTVSWTRGAMTGSYGLHLNHFKREHTRDLVGGARDYANYGTKDEANTFAKLAWDRGRWHLHSDAQLRYTNFDYHGSVAIDPIHWTFFNPKVGARYDLSSRSGLYGSAGISTREPARNDLFQGEDDPSFAHDLHAVRPERLLDLELGWDYRTPTTSIIANVYSMSFRHEIASTGELSDIGLLLRQNVDRSYRRGIELEAVWQPSSALTFRTAANASRNRIHEWTQFYDVYDADGNYVTSEPSTHHDVNPLLTPSLIVNQSVDGALNGYVSLGATGRYVSKSYLDNTNDSAFVTPSFFSADARLSIDLSHFMARAPRLRVDVNNLTDNKRIFPNGYSYRFLTRAAGQADVPGGVSYYYPQATRNATVMLEWKL